MVYDAANKQFQLNVDMDGDGNPDTLAYDPATDSGGKSFVLSGNYGDPAFSVSGDPQDGDSFLITFNQGGVADNRNALQMALMQHDKTMLGDSSSPDNESATFQDVYGLMVADVGSQTRTSQINAKATDGLLERHQMAMSSISGVNLDEEAADLIRYQQAYQAAAQVIATANTMFNTLLGAIRG
jgi:flagellar hook-associated protein 1 FlgK